jgi:hypothetical protein
MNNFRIFAGLNATLNSIFISFSKNQFLGLED